MRILQRIKFSSGLRFTVLIVRLADGRMREVRVIEADGTPYEGVRGEFRNIRWAPR